MRVVTQYALKPADAGHAKARCIAINEATAFAVGIVPHFLTDQELSAAQADVQMYFPTAAELAEQPNLRLDYDDPENLGRIPAKRMGQPQLDSSGDSRFRGKGLEMARDPQRGGHLGGSHF